MANRQDRQNQDRQANRGQQGGNQGGNNQMNQQNRADEQNQIGGHNDAQGRVGSDMETDRVGATADDDRT